MQRTITWILATPPRNLAKSSEPGSGWKPRRSMHADQHILLAHIPPPPNCVSHPVGDIARELAGLLGRHTVGDLEHWDVRCAAREFHAASVLVSCRAEDPAVGHRGVHRYQWQ